MELLGVESSPKQELEGYLRKKQSRSMLVTLYFQVIIASKKMLKKEKLKLVLLWSIYLDYSIIFIHYYHNHDSYYSKVYPYLLWIRDVEQVKKVQNIHTNEKRLILFWRHSRIFLILTS